MGGGAVRMTLMKHSEMIEKLQKKINSGDNFKDFSNEIDKLFRDQMQML
jgi:hypothetical protein